MSEELKKIIEHAVEVERMKLEAEKEVVDVKLEALESVKQRLMAEAEKTVKEGES